MQRSFYAHKILYKFVDVYLYTAIEKTKTRGSGYSFEKKIIVCGKNKTMKVF